MEKRNEMREEWRRGKRGWRKGEQFSTGKRTERAGGRPALMAMSALLLLCLGSFPAFAEEKWNVEDNIVSFYEVPELVNRYSSLAETEQSLLSESTKGIKGVRDAVKDQKKDIVDGLSENIDALKEERDSTEDKTMKEALTKEIASLEKVKNSKKILPGLNGSLAEANSALTELSKTDKEMQKAEKKAEKSVRSGFLTGKALLSDGMQNLLFTYQNTENGKKLLEKRVELMRGSLKKAEAEKNLGKATENEVRAARIALQSAEADLQKAKDGLDGIKRNIGLALGWHIDTYQNMVIEPTPDFPRDYLSGRNFETDYQAVLDRNSAYGEILRMKEKNITGWTEKKQSKEEKKEEIRVSLQALWQSIEEKNLALTKAETDSRLSALKRDKATRMQDAGLLGRVEKEGMEIDALQSENTYESARLAYNQAVFQYEEAVNKGILSLS